MISSSVSKNVFAFETEFHELMPPVATPKIYPKLDVRRLYYQWVWVVSLSGGDPVGGKTLTPTSPDVSESVSPLPRGEGPGVRESSPFGKGEMPAA